MQVNELRKRYIEQLPMIAAMLIPDEPYDPKDVAEEALALVDAILELVEEHG